MATCAITPEKQRCGVYIAEEVPSEGDKTLARLYIRHGEIYVNETVLNTSLVEIRHLIDIPRLKDHLLKHQVIGRKQLDEITNHYHSRDDQVDNLLKCVGCAGGKHGYFLLYVSLCESSVRVSHRGHKDAVCALQNKAKELEVVAPESILCACRMLHQQKLKHDDESSAGEANLSESGYESKDSLIYKCHCRGDCTIRGYINGSKCQKSAKEKFQYLILPPNSYEALKLELTLCSQSEAIKSEFAKVVVDMFKRLRKIPFEDVKLETKVLVCTGNYDTEVFGHKPATNCIIGTTDHNQLEDALMQNYFSWFNFAIIKVLRNKFLFPDGNDKVLQDYEEKFSYYCRRRCFESPETFHPKPLEDLTSLVFKIEEDFGDFTVHQVKKVTAIVAKVINAPSHALYVKSVNEGCVEVSCYILPQFQPSYLKEIQISQLKDHNISSFKIKNMELIPQDSPCRRHLYQEDNLEQPESSSDLEGYDASSEKSDSEDTPSIISKEGTFEAADDSNREDKDFDMPSIPPTPASPETPYEESPNNSAFMNGSSKFNFSSQAVTTAASKWQNGICHSQPQSNHTLFSTKEEEQSETDYSDMEDTGYVIQLNDKVQTPDTPTANKVTDEGASTGVTPPSTMPKKKQESVVSNIGSDVFSLGDYSTTDHDIDSKFDLSTVSPQRSLKLVKFSQNHTPRTVEIQRHVSRCLVTNDCKGYDAGNEEKSHSGDTSKRITREDSYPHREPIRGHPIGAHPIGHAEELKRGDHVLYQVTKCQYRQMHYSALVKRIDMDKGTVEVMTNSTYGIVEKEISLDEFSKKNLYGVDYSHQQDIEMSINMAEKRAHLNENHYHTLHNNSHQFVSFCITNQEYELTDILKCLPFTKEIQSCNSTSANLNHVVIKERIERIGDLRRGSHLFYGNVHYLVSSVDTENETFSTYSICENKRAVLHKDMKWSSLINYERLECTSHQDRTHINVDEALEKAENKAVDPKRRWCDSACFVTSMLCGVEHAIDERFLIDKEIPMSGCTLITPKVPVKQGDHLLIKDFSNEFKSVLVIKLVDDTRVFVLPPLAGSETLDLTTHPEILRVEYSASLPPEEAAKRANSLKGQNVLQTHSRDPTCFVNWAKVGKEVPTNIKKLFEQLRVDCLQDKRGHLKLERDYLESSQEQEVFEVGDRSQPSLSGPTSRSPIASVEIEAAPDIDLAPSGDKASSSDQIETNVKASHSEPNLSTCPSQRREFKYEKISSLQDLTPGEHVVESLQGGRRHLMVTESDGTSTFKVISCSSSQIIEVKENLDLSEERQLYKVCYKGEMSVSSSTSSSPAVQDSNAASQIVVEPESNVAPDIDEASGSDQIESSVVATPNLFVKRARSCVGQQLHSPWSHMLFLTWVKTGQKDDFEFNTCSQPVSKSKIVSFDQLSPADYLLVTPSSFGWSSHYLVISVESSMECTVIECDRTMMVTKKQLQLNIPDKYYRINYQPGAYISNRDSVNEALSYDGKRVLEYPTSEAFIHHLKTYQALIDNPSDLCEYQPELSKGSKCFTSADFSSKDVRAPKYIRRVTSLDMISPGSHIIYRINKPPFPPVYCSAIVLSKVDQGESEQVKTVNVTLSGVHETTQNFDSLQSLYLVCYRSCLSELEVVASALKLIVTYRDKDHHYDERFNNSHHFVTRCMTGREYPLTKFLNEIARNEQGGSACPQDELKPVLTKVPLSSIEDISRGDHVVFGSNHYLVDSVEQGNDKIIAYSTSGNQNVVRVDVAHIRKKISKKTIFIVKYDPYSSLSDVETTFERINRELRVESKWLHNDRFVTMMKCGTEFAIDDRCCFSQEVAMVGVTPVTPHTSVDIGDHLLIKDGETFHSSLVCKFVDLNKVLVIPPVNSKREIDLADQNTYPEVYRVNYNQQLPSNDVMNRAHSSAGKSILQSESNSHGFVSWAKTGRQMIVDEQDLLEKRQIEISYPTKYKKILSPDEFEVGQHIFLRWQYLKPYRDHLLITECNVDQNNPRKFRVMSCCRKAIKETVMELDPGRVGEDIYQVIYQDELPPDKAVERARSLLGQYKFRLDSRMWFVPWAKTGSDDGIEVDFLRNLTMPASKSRIACFTQLKPGDYLVEEKNHNFGVYHHYLVESVESPEKCTVFESWRGILTRKQLTLTNASHSGDHPWFYRINYESGICILPEESIAKTQSLIKDQKWPFPPSSEYARRSCIHYLKTTENVDINVNKLIPDRTLLEREVIKSAFELKCGDHIERPMSFASSFAQHHMLVVEPVDEKHCKVIHYQVNPTLVKTAKMRKGKVVEEIINIFDQEVCYRVCYSERIDPELGMAKLRKICGEEEYHVNNCEHLIMIATLGMPLSIQVEKAIYHALRTTKGIMKGIRGSVLHHGVHMTQEGTVHGAMHATQSSVKHGIRAAISVSVLGSAVGIAFALNVLVDGPLCVRSLYKLSRKNTFGKISDQEYRCQKATVIIQSVNSSAGGTLGAVAGQVALVNAPIAGAVVGGVKSNIVGQMVGHLRAKAFCSIMYPDLFDVSLPVIIEKRYFIY